MFSLHIATRTKYAVCAGLLGASSLAIAMPAQGDWNAPVNAGSLPGSSSSLNTPAVDGCVALSRDGLEIYLTSNRAGNFDIYVAERAAVTQGF